MSRSKLITGKSNKKRAKSKKATNRNYEAKKGKRKKQQLKKNKQLFKIKEQRVTTDIMSPTPLTYREIEIFKKL